MWWPLKKAARYLASDPPAGPHIATKVAAEFVGCMLFHFMGSVCPTALANATAVAVLVYYTAKMSGAHLNPAVTATFALLGYTTPKEALAYWAAQVAGCLTGALWVRALVPSDRADPPLGCFHATVSRAGIFGWEAACTFCFIMPIFSVVWYTQHKNGYGNTGPLIVGLSLYAAASAAGEWTGGALNPARAVASPIVFPQRCAASLSNAGYYVLGEMAGAVLVPLATIPWYGVSHRLGEQDDMLDSPVSLADIMMHQQRERDGERERDGAAAAGLRGDVDAVSPPRDAKRA